MRAARKVWHIGPFTFTFDRGVSGTGFVKMVTSLKIQDQDGTILYLRLHQAEV